MEFNEIYVNKKAKSVRVGEVVCYSDNLALFGRMELSIDIREAIDSLSKPLEQYLRIE